MQNTSTSREDVIKQLASAASMDPDDLTRALNNAEVEYGADEVAEGLQAISERLVPTGEGLTRKEAQKALVEEMDYLILASNQRRLRNFKQRVDKFWEAKQHGQKAGQYPKEPVLIKGFGKRHLQQAVFMARQRGGYESLLKAAGF